MTKANKKAEAIFHFDCKVHGRATGTNAIKLAAYRSGSRLRSETGRIHNYSRKKDVAYTAILAPKDAQPWVFDRQTLWSQVDGSEHRKDAQLAREIEIALPLALEQPQQIRLLRTWVKKTFVSAGMVADVCVHAKRGNPHCHILLTLRELEMDGFGKKNRKWNDPRLVEAWRESWAAAVNKYLARAGVEVRIDHRSYKRQGIDKTPTKHVGRDNGMNSERIKSKKMENDLIKSGESIPSAPADHSDETVDINADKIQKNERKPRKKRERKPRHKNQMPSTEPTTSSHPSY